MIDTDQLKLCGLCSLRGDNYALPRIHKGEGKKIMIIGEAPGRIEAREHLAFVGQSGKLLDKWIEYLKLDNYIITNVVKHRPIMQIGSHEYNRAPNSKEIEACIPFLWGEIESHNPDLFIVLGQTARDVILPYEYSNKMTFSVLNSLEKPMYYHDKRAFVLYHPAFILHNHRPMEPYLDKIKKWVD